jgi:hypothetical protein
MPYFGWRVCACSYDGALASLVIIRVCMNTLFINKVEIFVIIK